MFTAAPCAARGSAVDRSSRAYPVRPDPRSWGRTWAALASAPTRRLDAHAQPGAGLERFDERTAGTLRVPLDVGGLRVEEKALEHERLSGGHLLSAISNSIVRILRERYGRGPMKAKTYALDDIIVVVLRAGGFTAAEQTMIDSGEPDRVVEMREDFQRVMAQDYKETIERLTDRKVLAFLSNAHVEPELTLEVFFVDRPLDGFGAVEVTAPG
jgi:uncharacterized protein YbcI